MQRIIRRTYHKTNMLMKQNPRSPTIPLPTDFFQKSLPTLPYPDLHRTLSAFLEQQSTVMDAKKFQELEKLTNEFYQEDIKVLDQMMYEEYQHNKRIYGGYQCIDSLRKWRFPTLRQTYGSLGYHVDPSDTQLVIASKLLHSIGVVQKTLRDNSYKPVMFKSNPLFESILLQTPEDHRTQVAQGLGIIPFDMAVYRNTLSGTRLPGTEMDGVNVATESKNVVVIKNGNMFSFDIMHDNGTLLSTAELLKNLETVVLQSTGTCTTPIAALTAMKRDKWAEYRNYLMSNPQNAEAMKKIEDAITVLTLDGAYEGESRGKLMLHGEIPGNRWFDKNLAFSIDESLGIVTASGTSTETHGDIMANVTDDVLDVYENLSTSSRNVSSSQGSVESLNFSIDDKLREGVEVAKKEFSEIFNDYQCVHIESDNFGRKEFSKHQLSPDSVCHVATQITFMKLLGRPQNVISPVMVPSFINSHYFVTFAPWRNTIEVANRYVSQGKVDLSALKLHSDKYVSLLMQMRHGLVATEPHLRALIEFARSTGKAREFFEHEMVEKSLLARMDVATVPSKGIRYMVLTGFNGAMAFGNLFKKDKFYGTVTSSNKDQLSPESFKKVFQETMDDLLKQIRKQQL